MCDLCILIIANLCKAYNFIGKKHRQKLQHSCQTPIEIIEESDERYQRDSQTHKSNINWQGNG